MLYIVGFLNRNSPRRRLSCAAKIELYYFDCGSYQMYLSYVSPLRFLKVEGITQTPQ